MTRQDLRGPVTRKELHRLLDEISKDDLPNLGLALRALMKLEKELAEAIAANKAGADAPPTTSDRRT